MAFKPRDAAGKILMFPLTTIAVALGITVVVTDVLDHADMGEWLSPRTNSGV